MRTVVTGSGLVIAEVRRTQKGAERKNTAQGGRWRGRQSAVNTNEIHSRIHTPKLLMLRNVNTDRVVVYQSFLGKGR